MTLKKRTIVRGGRSFVTEHTFHDSSQRFADYHRPWRTVETGDGGQTRETEHEFDYAFDANRWFKDKIRETRVRTNGEWFVVSRAFNDNSGFVDSETRYGITTAFEADPSGTGNVGAATDPHGHRTTFSYQWGA